MDIKKVNDFLFLKKTLPDNLLQVNIEYEKKLNNMLEPDHLTVIKKAFDEAPNQRLDAQTLRQLLKDVAKLNYSDEEFAIEYLKMVKPSDDSYMTWSSFTNFLIGQFKEEELRRETIPLELPIVSPLRVIKSNHRQPITRICFYPSILPNKNVSWINGSYLTLSKDGVINYWTMDLELSRTVHSKCTTLKFQPTWVTDMVVMPDVSTLCTSSTECELRFYDTSAKKFYLRLLLTSLDCAVLTMSYYYDLTKPEEESKLVLGDQNGTVRIIFINPINRGPFKSEPGNLLRQIQWDKFVKGVYCMDFMDSKHIIVTGGPDCMIRLWHTFIQRRPTTVLSGHHTAIVIVILQDGGKQLFSMSQDRIVKIWNLTSLSCIQTYKELQKELSDSLSYGYFYNNNTQQVLIGLAKITVLVVYGKLNPEETDGYTHTDSVSVILFNPLFKILLSCGIESSIISWDPFTGTRLRVIKEAHAKLLQGDVMTVAITAATFNPKMRSLLTGARDGTLKVWCFQTGTCQRQMAIEPDCEVTAVKWIPLRIFAMGWNRHVTEFADTKDQFGCKLWDVLHRDDIICADIRIPGVLATASSLGGLVFWRLDGSQPDKRFDVSNPTRILSLKHHFRNTLTKVQSTFSTSTTVSNKSQRKTKLKSIALPMEPITLQALQTKANKALSISAPEQIVNVRPCGITVIKFLQTRPVQPDVGTILVSLENGFVQIYSHHSAGNFLKAFKATHSVDDYVTTLETDMNDEYLFTGTKNGYIKTWLIINYALPEERKVSMPKYRLIFPFLWTDVIQCRAKRAVRNQPLPILCNSYRAHVASITSLVYINHCQILCSASRDQSVRLWTLGGKYLNTLGTFQPWTEIPPFGPPPADLPNKIPPDVKRIASWTTLKVLNEGDALRTVKKKLPPPIRPLSKEEREKGIYGKPLTEPFLGNHFKLPCRTTKSFHVELDDFLPLIPIYSHLKVEPPTKEVGRIPSPKFLIERKARKLKDTEG